MFKKLWFQLHWLLGITAGVVLAVVGLTGATLSFESDILRWLNPEVMTVPVPASEPLPVAERVRIAQAAMPEKTVIGVTVESRPDWAGQIGFAGGRRGEWLYQNPYTGELLGKPTRGEDLLHLMEDIHRRLAAGDVGKQIVGASTLMLLLLAFTGLYLRWPKQRGNWRAWLTFSFARKGRSFLWDMHAAIGTWVLPLYLLAALTGLYWSYDWYRNGLFELTGAPRPTAPTQQMPAPTVNAPTGNATSAGNNAQTEQGRSASATNSAGEQPPPAPTSEKLAQLWATFEQTLAAPYQRATLRFSARAEQPFEFRYLDADPAHDRANNLLQLDGNTGAVTKHERYAELPPGSKLMRSMFALHSGGFFGITGLLLMMIASLLMPLFAITGWMLYLDRRGKKRAAKRAAAALHAEPAAATNSPMLIAYASQTGFAEQIAWQSAGLLQATGLPVQVTPLAQIDDAVLAGFQRALFVVSTFGDGEAPDAARGFVKRVLQQASNQQVLKQQASALSHLRYGVLALGDKHYQAFCGFGRAVEEWLCQYGAQALFGRIDVDKADPQALADWQRHLHALGGSSADRDAANIDWGQQQFQSWTLQQRTLLNPGSLGAPMFQLLLSPPAGSAVEWRAGDLLDVLPRQSADVARAMRSELGLALDAQWNGEPIEQWLSRFERPSDAELSAWRALPLNELAEKLQPLAPRTYSIASIPVEGRVELLVRQEQHDDGSLGIGSGWLTRHLPVGASVSATVRSNTGFHCDNYQRPLILIGNGSGLSALRAHLRQAAEQASKGHWLIFGERSQQTDFYYQSEIKAWQADGTLAKLDLAFSRDQPQRLYV
ncbi:MAG TPA: PepSY domain-containing protein, partial [Permianibacter sp.]|nr:PepSY domain-containing protein [Permianibacter sp.]